MADYTRHAHDFENGYDCTKGSETVLISRSVNLAIVGSLSGANSGTENVCDTSRESGRFARIRKGNAK